MSDADSDSEYSTSSSDCSSEDLGLAETEAALDDSKDFDLTQCKAAIEGKELPETLHLIWHRRATIRGIRSSLEFAMSAPVTALCTGTETLAPAYDFCRARNARLIMSDVIPDLSDLSCQPYCIWYPDLAHENNYREIARRYPSLRYHVGRACAVAGYTDLYKELDLLPDISIAEEASRKWGNRVANL